MKFIAKVEDAQMGRINETAGHLKDLGMNVDYVLKSIGTISGSTKGSDLSRVKIAGIKSVEPDRKLSGK